MYMWWINIKFLSNIKKVNEEKLKFYDAGAWCEKLGRDISVFMQFSLAKSSISATKWIENINITFTALKLLTEPLVNRHKDKMVSLEITITTH